MSSEKLKGASRKPPKPQPGPFSWVKPAFRSRRTVKTWIRCCVAIAATLVLMVARRTGDVMGQAAFFALIVAVLLPPSLALSVFLLASTILLLGMLLGWAWGNAAMAAALAARSSSLLAQQKQKLASSLLPNIPVDIQTQIATFHGIFLDPRSSTIYGVFLFIGTFAMGALQAHLPNLTLLCIFGSIVLDVICTTGPLLPTARYTIAKTFIIPTSFYLAVAIASLILIFPESLSHVWVTSLCDQFLNPTLDLLRLQSEALKAQPSDHEAWSELNTRGDELRSNLTVGVNAVTGQIKLMDLDTSIGRLGPADLKKINGELRSIMFRARGLHSFQAFVNDTNLMEQKQAEEAAKEARNKGDETLPTMNRYLALMAQIKAREIQHGHDLDSLVPILASSSAELRTATESALVCVISWLQDCNSRRLKALFRRTDNVAIEERQQRLLKELRTLEEALENFRTVERVKLVKPYEKFFDPVTRRLSSKMFASRSLYICFVFIDTLDAFAERMLKMLTIVTELDAQRPKVKIWFPGRIATVKGNLMGNEFKGAGGPLQMGTVDDPETFDSSNSPDGSQSNLADDDEEQDATLKKDSFANPPSRRNPDAFPPTTGFGRFIVKFAAFLRFFKSPGGIFALRMGIVSVALWVPSVCEKSAWFYYDNKGIWALIMAQTGLAIYAGDQIASFVIRLSGTLLGLLIGMAVWYIGAGLGHGNPYGIVVATTVVLSPFILGRVGGPPSQVPLWTMVSVTVVFVTGYSWVNANQIILANTGVGVALGWKRALLVIIGFTAAFIVMLFPNPISSRVLVRKTLAAVVSEGGHIFAGEVEAFLAEEARAQRGEYANIKVPIPNSTEDDENVSSKERRIRRIAKRFIDISARLQFIHPSLTTAKLEPQLAGTWPHGQYEQLFMIQSRTLGSLALLITAFAKLDTKWCSALVHRTPYMNPNFLSDVFMTITILSNTLMGGSPLPAYLPKLRERLVYHEYHSGGGNTNPSLFKPCGSGPGPNGNEKSLHEDSSSEDIVEGKNDEDLNTAADPANVDGSSMGLEDNQLTLDVLLNEQLPVYSTAIVALSNLVSRIDDTIEIVRTLCGEASFQGYETLQRDYLDREERAVRDRYNAC